MDLSNLQSAAIIRASVYLMLFLTIAAPVQFQLRGYARVCYISLYVQQPLMLIKETIHDQFVGNYENVTVS